MELPDLNEMDDIILDIEEDDGTTTQCQVIAMFEYEDLAYAALTPTDEDAAEAYIFSVEYEDQGDEMEFTLTNIDDEKKLEEVGKVFMQLMSEAEEDIGEDSDDEGWDEFIHKKIEEL